MGKFQPKNILPGCFFAFLLFLMCLEGLTTNPLLQTIFKHIDEALVLLCLVYLVLHFNYLLRKKHLLVALWIGFMLTGFVSSCIFHYQALLPTVIDAVVVVSKFMVGYLTVYVYSSTHSQRISDSLVWSAKVITVILFLIAIYDTIMPTPIFPRGEYRYFIYSLRLMFPHQTYLAAAAVSLLIFLGYTNKHGRHIVYMLMATFLGMMTLRGKAIAFFLVYWLLYVCIMTFRNRHYWALIAGGGLLSFVVAFEQIQDYFLTTTRYSPRQILMQDSFELMFSHFPFGTGFGTFGSTIADQYYSPLYYKFGYDGKYGMGPTDSMFLSDSFWPEIFAQFGAVGTILFVTILALFLIYSIRMIRRNRSAGFAMLLIMVNMLINSLAESAFFNPASFLLFGIFALCEAENPPSRLKRNCEP